MFSMHVREENSSKKHPNSGAAMLNAPQYWRLSDTKAAFLSDFLSTNRYWLTAQCIKIRTHGKIIGKR